MPSAGGASWQVEAKASPLGIQGTHACKAMPVKWIECLPASQYKVW